MEYFRQVLRSDIADVQGGTTQEGIHLAAMAGSIDLLQRCYSGLELRDDRLVLSPQWPEALGPLEFPFVYRRHQLSLRISGRSATLTAESGDAEPIEVEWSQLRSNAVATCSGYGAGTPSKSVAAGDQCRTWWVDDLSWKGRPAAVSLIALGVVCSSPATKGTPPG